ncbi:hypothetical protein QQ045_031754 [Rhodiola kirilowii]
MTHAILEVVAGGIVQSANDISRYVRCTLLNSTKPFDDVVKSAKVSLRWLCQTKFIEWNVESKIYSTTPLGHAAFGSSLCPEESLAIAEASVHDLVKALFESSSWTAQENVTKRRMHLGIAKKIKNGARKIVLEKAEEARLAAFSAFKSLGFDYPHLSQLILPIVVENLPEQGNGPTSSGEHSHASIKLLIEGSENPSDSGDAVVQVLPKSSLPSSNYPIPVEVRRKSVI